MFGKNPADGSYSGWRSYNAVESNLAHLDDIHGSSGSIDNKVIEYVLVCVDEQRVLSRKGDAYDWSWEFLEEE